jgi:hypothetical protein
MKDYNADEWKAISAAPAAAGLAISLSNAGETTGGVDETALISEAITRAFVNAPEIVRIVAELSKESRPELPTLPAGDRAHARLELIATVRKAVRAIEMKSPAEAEPFKTWLASVAAKVCHATSPDGGRTQVSRGQQDTIDRLAEVLAVSPSVVCSRVVPRAVARN